MSSFTTTFGNNPVSTSYVAFAAYSFGTSFASVWPAFSNNNPNVCAQFMNLTATASGLNFNMPDATQVSVGQAAIIFNAGSNSFNVVSLNGNAIATIATGQTYYIMLTNNSTQDGTWQVVQFGVGTGSAVASALAGLGLQASGGVLNVNFPVNVVTGNISVTSANLAQLQSWQAGSGTINLPAASTVGNGFFFMFSDNGSGSVTLQPAGSDQIDGASSSIFNQTQSAFIVCSGGAWYTVGKGSQLNFAITVNNLNVAGSSNVTLTSAQAQSVIQQFTGLLTGNIEVIVPNTPQIYFVYNNTTGAFTLKMTTSGGTGIFVPQGSNAVLYCDGTNVNNGFTSSVGGALSIPPGSASNPSLNFVSNTNTGLFSPATNVVGVAAAGLEAMDFIAPASSVNWLQSIASVSGSPVVLQATGTDATVSITIQGKGTGTVNLANVSVTGGAIDNTPIGASMPAAITGTNGAFSGNLSVTGFINGSSTISATQIISTISTGNPPLVVSSTTPVPNLNAAMSAYPVGSIYISTVATNPATLFGFGTWVAYAAGQVLIGVGSFTDGDGNSETITAGEQLGEYLHTLTTAELASHTHTATVTDPGHSHTLLEANAAGATASFDQGITNTTTQVSGIVASNTTGITVANSSTGSGTGHNNIQPSIGVYIWERTV